jgi:hypothetical protein
VWVKKDLVQKRVFSQEDCFPVGREGLPIPKKISFSRDLWSEKTGKTSFADIVKMAGGGRGGGHGGARRGSGKAASNLGQKQGQSIAATQAQGQAPPLNQVFPAAENLGGSFLPHASVPQQGMFPMVPPGLWNVPLGQWQQFFAQPGMGQMMQMPQGFGGSVQTGTASNSSSGVPVTSQQAQRVQQPAKMQRKSLRFQVVMLGRK